MDSLASKDFTLAFVTGNGNVTYTDVRLMGKVEVGKTLTVRGEAKFLDELLVAEKNVTIAKGDVNLGTGTIHINNPNLIRNLNAEYFQNLVPSNFTLDFVVENGNETNRLAFFKGGLYGGAGDYDRFLRGITLALESGIKIAFNRVLFKEHTDDLPEQLAFVERRKSRLKLYTLMWTPQSAATHEKFYQDWRPVVRTTVLSRTVEIVRVRKQVGRGRLRFNLIGGGSVEIKLGDKLDRSAYPCSSCSFKNECEEGFGDYVRVDPRLHLYFCYMRRDIGFQIPEYFGRPKELKQKIGEVFGNTDIVRLLATTPLRLTVTPFCNFNCRSPGAVEGWCMEEPGEYIYPKIRPTLLGKEI